MYSDGTQLRYVLLKHCFLLHLSCGDGFCSPWSAIHILIQSDWLPPDAESMKLDLSHFCFYWEHGGGLGGAQKATRGGKPTDELTDITCDALGSNFISRQLSGWKVHRMKPTSPSAFAREERCTQQELHVFREGACQCWGVAARPWKPGWSVE